MTNRFLRRVVGESIIDTQKCTDTYTIQEMEILNAYHWKS